MAHRLVPGWPAAPCEGAAPSALPTDQHAAEDPSAVSEVPGGCMVHTKCTSTGCCGNMVGQAYPCSPTGRLPLHTVTECVLRAHWACGKQPCPANQVKICLYCSRRALEALLPSSDRISHTTTGQIGVHTSPHPLLTRCLCKAAKLLPAQVFFD